MLCYIFNFQKHIHCYYWCDFAVKWEILGTKFDFDLILYVTLTSDDLDSTSNQMAGHMLDRNDTLFVIVHNLFQMLCTNPEAYVGWRPFWICLKIGHLPWRDFWGFSTVCRYGTNELISGEKPFIAMLSNLRVYFVVRLPDYIGDNLFR